MNVLSAILNVFLLISKEVDAQITNMDTKDEITENFEQLLVDLSRNQAPSLEISMDDLRQEVLDFVQDNVKISKILEEISEEALFSKDLTQMTEYACANHFYSIAQSTNTPVSLVASQILAQQLADVMKQGGNQFTSHLLPYDVKQKVEILLDIIEKTKENGISSFDELIFIKSLPYKEIPMELIWLLNEQSIVPFRACFLSWFADKEWLETFYESIASFCFDSGNGDIVLQKRILQVFVGDLLWMSYGETSERRATAEEMQSILFKVIKHADERAERLASEQIKQRLCLYKIIRELREVPSDVIKKFFQEIVSDLLTAKPCSVRMVDAFACQEKWTFEFLSEATKTKYSQYVLVFCSGELIQIMQSAVESITSEAVDVKAFCHLLTVFLLQNEDAYKLFDDFLQQCLSECLETCDTLQFRLILLLRRQAALEGAHISPSYSTWFEQTFCTNAASLGLTSKKTIHFLFKSLTELVPHDQPEFLKVHIFKCPQVPSKFRYYVEDYVSLAKTRLQDLNISVEDHSRLFSTQNLPSEESVKVVEQAQSDVEKCLSLYEQSGRIPTTIMEASIFRKPYFIGRFLPALLLPRNLSQEADVRARLIEDLNRAGKIPAAMFKSYTKKCEEFDDFSNDDEPRNSIQKLTDCLEKLPNLLVDMATRDDDTKAHLQSWLSSVSRKLKSIFGSSGHEKAAETIDLDAVASNIDKDYMQASYIIINIFCRACIAVQNVNTSEIVPPSRRLSKFVWASKFVSVLVSFPRLIQSLYLHLWSTICQEPHVLSPEHINGLAILVCHLSCFKSSSNIRLQSKTEAESDFHHTFVDLISSRISLSSRVVCQFFLRWSCSYLQYAMAVFENLTKDLDQLSCDGRSGCAYVPNTMLMKMEYLYQKLKFGTAKCGDTMFLEKREVEILSVLVKSINDTKLLPSSLSFKQWLAWELSIYEDFLEENERMQYYNSIIYENFMPLAKTEKDEELAACKEMATELVSSLLDHWTSSQKIDTEKARSSTETNLVKILQDIVSLMGSNLLTQHARDNIWFLDCIIARLGKIEKDESPSCEIQARCEVMAFLRLVTNLPSWLLVSNSEWERLTDEGTKKLSCFLNDNLKPCLFPGSRILPFNFTAHIFKIFVKDLSQRDEKLRKPAEEIFGSFITNTYFITASLIYYWEQLKPVYRGLLTSSNTLDQLQLLHTFLASILTSTEQPSDHNVFPRALVCEVGLSYAIFVYILKRIKSPNLEIKDFVHRLENLVETLLVSKAGKKIVIHLFDGIVAYLASNIFQEDETKIYDVFWSNILTAILCHYPDALCVFTQELKQDEGLLAARAVLFERKLYRVLPILFFRIFTLKELYVLQHKIPVEVFVEAVLVMYIQCTELYQSCSDAALSKQPLDLDNFVKITVYVKECLSRVPSAVFQRMPEFVVTKLPKEIKRYFSR